MKASYAYVILYLYTAVAKYQDVLHMYLFLYMQSMMNSCLQKPCASGFAYHPQVNFQVDYSGAFRYVSHVTLQ